ncbi:conserved hypothetical protein [Trichinella spiralis]|uniref:hypothetical protein n=1 Tax=Trichinella spiralis TaxID=6334 RepID=UPI0001EFEFE7|nr:conserved hypothetical protein [Trichinella spiralis]
MEPGISTSFHRAGKGPRSNHSGTKNWNRSHSMASPARIEWPKLSELQLSWTCLARAPELISKESKLETKKTTGAKGCHKVWFNTSVQLLIQEFVATKWLNNRAVAWEKQRMTVAPGQRRP